MSDQKIFNYDLIVGSMTRAPSKNHLKIGMMDIDLLDNGTRHPNLAQMKMSAYCKNRGHDVRLLFTDEDLNNLSSYDLLLASKVFNFTKTPEQLDVFLQPFKDNMNALNGCVFDALNRYEKKKPKKTVLLIGGTGFFEKDGGRNLHDEIEHTKPDYTLYSDYVESKINEGRKRSYFDDYLNYSIGFTSRGCFRKCHFCVNRKYDHAFLHSPVEEFLDDSRPMIYLWDDNIFALRDGWESVFDQLIATGKPFQFRQGLDIRMLQEGHAKKLRDCKYHGDFIFAFDHVDQAKLIERKLQLWRKWCSKTTKFYVLCAFDSWDYEVISNDLQDNYHHYYLERMNGLETQDLRDQEDIEGVFERISILMKYGCLPYIMRFQNYKQSKYCGMYTELARWCNQPQFFKKKSFRQFCEANRDYNGTENCASYHAMVIFERDRPDIASKYFDMRFDEMNECIVSYGRRLTRPCNHCIQSEQYVTWESFFKEEISTENFLRHYYAGDLDQLCLLSKKCPHCGSIDKTELSLKILETLNSIPIDDIVHILDEIPEAIISSDGIPQISGLDVSVNSGLKVLQEQDYSFTDFGLELPGTNSDSSATKQRAGKNCAKLLALLDLAWIDKTTKPYSVRITPLGHVMQSVGRHGQREILEKLMLRIPIIQSIIREAKSKEVILDRYFTSISSSTVSYRHSSINIFLRYLMESESVELKRRLKNVEGIVSKVIE